MHTINILKIRTATIDSVDNVITDIVYEMSYTEGNQTVSDEFKLMICDPHDPETTIDGQSFTQLPSVTENQIKGWIEADPVTEKLKLSLTQRIPKAEVTTEASLPWA